MDNIWIYLINHFDGTFIAQPTDTKQRFFIVTKKGAGEFFFNLVDKDGMCNGYDVDFIKQFSKKISTPLIVCGGANKMEDFKYAIDSGADACAVGSMFIYKGNHKAVMINYPKYNDILNFFKSEL